MACCCAGVRAGLDPSGCDIAIVGEFGSVEDYKAYATHPAHTGLIATSIKPLLEARTAAQFELVRCAHALPY